MMLGRLPRREDPRTFKLARYMRTICAPPNAVQWSARVPAYGMFANDQVGDCTCAAAAHAVQTWTGNVYRAPLTVHDDAVIELYQSVSGYDPRDSSTDVGASLLDALRMWHHVGLRWPKGAYDNCGAYAEVEPLDTAQVRHAIHLFGGVYTGFMLPASAQSEETWTDTSGTAGTWGGHCVWICDYDDDGFVCVTWGGLQRLTSRFMRRYCDEAYAVFDSDWLDDNDRAPSGFDRDALKADLASL